MEQPREMCMRKKVLMLASVASMIDQFNMPNIRLLQEMGYEVSIACNFEEGNTCDAARIRKLKKILRNMCVTVYQWDCPRNIYAISKCVRAYYQLSMILQLQDFAWIHCHSPSGGALGRIAAYKNNVKVVYTAHGFHFYQGAPVKNWLLYYPAEKLLSYITNILITVNREDYVLAKRLLKAKRIYYIPGIGIDIGRFPDRRPKVVAKNRRKVCKAYQIPENAILLLSVGELSIRKNHRTAIRALAELRRVDVYYLICGQGEQKQALLGEADKLGVSRYIRFAGYQENVADIYYAADIFVFPSLQEGMPVALMEAMASGLPCVASLVRGSRELTKGVGFTPLQVQQLRNMLELFIDDPKQREYEGSNNRKRIQLYQLCRVQNKMKRIYQELGGNVS